MYIGFLSDRKLLGYPALKDTSCGIKLVLIIDVKGKRKRIKRIMIIICLEVLVILGNVASSEAKGDGTLPVAESFSPPISRRVQNNHGYLGNKLASGQNPGGGGNGGSGGSGGSGGNPNPSSGSKAGSCSSNPTPKARPERVNWGSRYPHKTKNQEDLEKRKKEFKKSIQKELKEIIEEENKMNAQRKKNGKSNVTLTIKDNIRLFALNDQLRDKYHHVLDLNSPIPETLSKSELGRLADPSLYRERLKTFRNKEILPEVYVEQYGRDLRLHILDPETKIIEGTLGANRAAKGGAAKGGAAKIEGYHLYNDTTGFNAFFDKNTNRYRTGFILSDKQINDIKTNKNVM